MIDAQIEEKECFLSYEYVPYFKAQTLRFIQNVQLLHGYHLYWPQLGVVGQHVFR